MEQRYYETSYGYFADEGREYVIKTPTTPKPWINVISNRKNYGLVVSQTGGGYSWYRHARQNRLTRWNQDIVRDNWGKYIYIRDNKTGKFSSCTYQPTKLKTKYYKCRHGLGYTVFENLWNDILCTLTITVAPDDTIEIWSLALENKSSKKKDLSLFTYFEWALGVAPDAHREFHKLFIETEYDSKNKSMFATKRLCTVQARDGIPWNSPWDYVAFHSSSVKPSSYEGDKESFLGQYGDFNAPKAVKNGKCGNTQGKWNDSIASLNVNLKLNANQKKTVVFTLGLAESRKVAEKLISKYNSVSAAEDTVKKAKKGWLDLLGSFHIETPDKGFDFLNNYWLRYQAISGRIWGRSAYYQVGGDFGFRDQLQDSQIFLTIDPKLTRKQLLLNAEHQFKNGMVQHWWNPLNDIGCKNNITDNLLWLPFITIAYLKETADFDFLKEKVGYLDNNRKTSVFDHCLKAIEKSMNRLGSRGLPLIGEGDWNDGLCRVGNDWKGESVWLAHFLYGILVEWSTLLNRINKKKITQKFKEDARKLKDNINKHAWDGKWYFRATKDDGVILGSNNQEEGKIFLNAQTWAIMNEIIPQDRLQSVLEALDKHLYREYGPILFYPAYSKPDKKIGYLSRYAPGTRENAGLYTHAGCWAVIAEVVAQREDRAWDLYNKFMPVRRGMDPDFYKAEPYVTCGNVDGPDSANFGRGAWSWYSGSAGWLYKAAIDWLLGIRAEYDGLRVEPVLPDDWNECTIKRIFRGTTYNITIFKYDGPNQIIVDGKVHDSNVIPVFKDKKQHNVIFRITKNYPVKARKIG